MKLMFMELFKVDVDKFGDRVDHIATVGKASKRVAALSGLQEKPFVLVFNLQLPGDPPISIVSYFVLPPHLREQGEEYGKVLSLFDRFVDIPVTIPAVLTTAKSVPMDPIVDAKNTPPTDSVSVTLDAVVLNDKDEIESAEKELLMGHAVEIIEDYNGVRKPLVADAVSSENSPRKRSNSTKNVMVESNMKGSDSSNAAISSGNKAPIDRTWADSITDIIWPDPGPQNPGILDRKSFQNMRFKLIPNIVEGPWVIQMAVGSTPCLLGQKVVQRYFRGENYFEVDVHVGSSQIANKIITLCRTYGKSFTSNIGLVLQGESSEELPEKLLACIQLDKIDLDIRSEL
mmetsp:Transcript_4835/g.6750  ORF Transcript_4835/g.6750 Transcript_4835/m.6750 type:complete len:344 (-) Transcript_4835:137-1168(-)